MRPTDRNGVPAAPHELNGHGRPPSLAKLTQERKRLEEEFRISQLRARQAAASKQAHLLETWWDGWANDGWFTSTSDLFNRVRGRDEYHRQRVPPTRPTDRRHGDEWPIYRTQEELQEIVSASRLLVRDCGYAQAILENLVNYVIGGKGFAYDTISTDSAPDSSSDPGKQDTPETQNLLAFAKRFFDHFASKNQWWRRQREAYWRVQRDGGAFVRLCHHEDGTTTIRFIEPERILNPPGHSHQDGWSYGIQHQVTPYVDVEQVTQYHVVYADLEELKGKKLTEILGEFIPADEIVHIKHPSTDSTVKRGLPAFYGDSLNALHRASNLQRSISIGADIRAKIAMIWQCSTGTRQQVLDMLAGNQEYQRTDPVTGASINVQRRNPGEVVYVPEGQEVAPHPGGGGVPDHIQAVQGDLRLASSAFAVPESMTGDASNANFASSLVATAPFVKRCEADQEYFAQAFYEIIKRVFKHAVKCNLLPHNTLQIVDVEITPPKVVHKDLMQQAHVDQVLVMLGAKDRQTVSKEWGYDFDEVKARNLEWEQEHGAFAETIPGIPQIGVGTGTRLPGMGMGERSGVRESLLEETTRSSQFNQITGQDIRECSQCGDGECKNRMLKEGEGESYFADCPRDEQGHCEAGGGSGESNPERDSKESVAAAHKAALLAHKATLVTWSMKDGSPITHLNPNPQDVVLRPLSSAERQAGGGSSEDRASTIAAKFSKKAEKDNTADSHLAAHKAHSEAAEAYEKAVRKLHQSYDPGTETSQGGKQTYRKLMYAAALAHKEAAKAHSRHAELLRKLLREADSYFADCPRDQQGHCISSGGSSEPANDPHTEVHAKADHVAKSFLSSAANLPMKAVSMAVSMGKGVYNKAEQKYGPRWAKAILATAIVTMPTPFTMASVAAMTGLAHVWTRYVSPQRKVESMESENGEGPPDLTPEEIHELAQQLIKEMEDAFEAYQRDNPDDFKSDGQKMQESMATAIVNLAGQRTTIINATPDTVRDLNNAKETIVSETAETVSSRLASIVKQHEETLRQSLESHEAALTQQLQESVRKQKQHEQSVTQAVAELSEKNAQQLSQAAQKQQEIVQAVTELSEVVAAPKPLRRVVPVSRDDKGRVTKFRSSDGKEYNVERDEKTGKVKSVEEKYPHANPPGNG